MLSSVVDSSTASRAERIARYKEDRRRQLAAQYGNSSGNSPNASATNVNNTTRSSPKRTTSCQTNTDSGNSPRTTRTSRLRAAATAANLTIAVGVNGALESAGLASAELVKSPVSSITSSDCRKTKPEKDKSGKRKSNLNRSLHSEEVSSDTNDDKTRRRSRRFFPPEILQSSPLNSSTISDDYSTLQNSSSCLSNTNTSPLSSPITANLSQSKLTSSNLIGTSAATRNSANLSTTRKTTEKLPARKSDLSTHMENARKSIFSAAQTSRAKIVTSSPKSPKISHNKENLTNKTDFSNRREGKVSKRLDELTKLTRETLRKVESLVEEKSDEIRGEKDELKFDKVGVKERAFYDREKSKKEGRFDLKESKDDQKLSKVDQKYSKFELKDLKFDESGSKLDQNKANVGQSFNQNERKSDFNEPKFDQNKPNLDRIEPKIDQNDPKIHQKGFQIDQNEPKFNIQDSKESKLYKHYSKLSNNYGDVNKQELQALAGCSLHKNDILQQLQPNLELEMYKVPSKLNLQNSEGDFEQKMNKLESKSYTENKIDSRNPPDLKNDLEMNKFESKSYSEYPKNQVNLKNQDFEQKTNSEPQKNKLDSKKQPQSEPKVFYNNKTRGNSILKKKSLEEIQISETSCANLPVSILKRKISQEENRSIQTPPVTFSPNVVDNVTTNKRRGILKKRRSLDESQVVRHRSCSPCIYKSQRRSSLEEITRIDSPDFNSRHGILKTRDTRESSDCNSPQQQSILKRRKSGENSANSHSCKPQHVSIATAVILAVVDGAEIVQESFKPILKKKSFSEDCTSFESLSDCLKPILKKKSSSTDTEDEERPKNRPILKRLTESEVKIRKMAESDAELDGCDVKPILKDRQRLSFCDSDDLSKLNEEKNWENDEKSWENDGKSWETEKKVKSSEFSKKIPNLEKNWENEIKKISKKLPNLETMLNDLSNEFFKTDGEKQQRLSFCDDSDEKNFDSLECSNLSKLDDLKKPQRLSFCDGEISAAENFDTKQRRSHNRRSNTISTEFLSEDRKLVEKDLDRDLHKPRNLSVFELVMNFEGNTSAKQTESTATGAIPKKSSLKRNSDRYKTQPITVHELQASRCNLNYSLSPSRHQTTKNTSVQSLVELSSNTSPLISHKSDNKHNYYSYETYSNQSHNKEHFSVDKEHFSVDNKHFSVDKEQFSDVNKQQFSNVNKELFSNVNKDQFSTINNKAQFSVNNKDQFATVNKHLFSVNNSDQFSTVNNDEFSSYNDSLILKDSDENCTENSNNSKTAVLMSSDSAFQSLGDGLELEYDDDLVEGSLGKVLAATPTTPEKIPEVKVTTATPQKSNNMEKGKTLREEKSNRFSTQPITNEEVEKAAKMKNKDFEPENLSLAEKIKLFKTKTETVKTTVNLNLSTNLNRRISRFPTQPITVDEVHLARYFKPKKDKDNENFFEKKILETSSASKPVKISSAVQSLQFKLPALIPGLKPVTIPNNPLPKSSSAVKLTTPKSPIESCSQSAGEKYSKSADENDSKESIQGVVKVNDEERSRESRESDSKESSVYFDDEGISSNDENNSSSSAEDNAGDKSESVKQIVQSAKVSDSASDESSGSREIQRIISRDAMMTVIQKRKEIALFKSRDSNLDEPNSVAQLLESGAAGDMTQAQSQLASPRSNIGALQQQLQQSGDSEWRRRRGKLNNASEELTTLLLHVNASSNNNSFNNDDLLSEKCSVLAAKKDELDASSKRWKARVEKSDAVSFSVAGKMAVVDVPIMIASPDKRKRTPRPKRFKGKQDSDIDTSSTPVSPELDKSLGFKRSVSAQSASDESSGNETCLRSCGRTVKLSRPDDETFSAFFQSVAHKQQSGDFVDLDDLDSVTRVSDSLLVQKKNVQVVRRRVASSRNPVKTLAKRADICSEYTETSTGVVERETKRLHMEKLSKSSSWASEALAGLASKEDFSSVILKKSSTNTTLSQHLPYQSLMLLQIKGRRHIQTRLVEPVFSSINLGDNYLLITPKVLYNFTGTYSNIIEQSRAQDIVSHIQQKSDMGCKLDRVVNLDPLTDCQDLSDFWTLLGGKSGEIAQAGHPDEDEIYESSIVQTNMIYKLEKSELVPYEQFWGAVPKVEMLDKRKCLVFDFGSEMYVWSGKVADQNEKKTTLKLAKELWQTGFNYSDCSVNPVSVSRVLGSRSVEVKSGDNSGDSRPAWTLFAKLTQFRETILFKEKFLDWPDFSRIITIKKHELERSQSDSQLEISALRLPNYKYTPPNFIVENTNLGRGREFFDEETRRNYEITTLDITCWNILENTYEKLELWELGQFYEGDTYIIRWKFRVTITGRELSGKPSKHLQLGRERLAYFNWFGKQATVNEKGTAALLTVELDRENAKQFRVLQEKEPPAFLQLFNGKMIIFKGKRATKSNNGFSKTNSSASKSLFQVRGEIPQESFLLEVEPVGESLRSKTSFLLHQPGERLKLWHGCQSTEGKREVAVRIAREFFGEKSEVIEKTSEDLEVNELKSADSEVIEGKSGDLEVIKGKSDMEELFEEKGEDLGEEFRGVHYSLKEVKKSDSPLRLFKFSCVSGRFEVDEMLPAQWSEDATGYPFIQSDLYGENQPALFLVDNGHELWIWQGYWPDTDSPSSDSTLSSVVTSDTDDCVTGSGRVRWHAERRAVMQTAVNYWQQRQSSSESVVSEIPAYLVWAGLEPDRFTALFPTWSQASCSKAKLANLKEDKLPHQTTPLHTELALLSRTHYSLAELLVRPLPVGVDPTHLERYLDDAEFITVLPVGREEFGRLPRWKQTALKKEVGLF